MYLTGHFIPCQQGKLFISQIGEINGDTAILCLPSILEEMNYSRAVISKAHYQLAALYPCFTLDYFGCGDSEGDITQATVECWQQNILTTATWLVSLGFSQLIVIGHRFGGLLLANTQQSIVNILPIKYQILCQPVTSGKRFMQHLFRIKNASQLTSNNKVDWRQSLEINREIDIAGYSFTERLIKDIELLSFSSEQTEKLAIQSYYLALDGLAGLAVEKIISENAPNMQLAVIKCLSFWQVPEVFDQPIFSDALLGIVGKVK